MGGVHIVSYGSHASTLYATIWPPISICFRRLCINVCCALETLTLAIVLERKHKCWGGGGGGGDVCM